MKVLVVEDNDDVRAMVVEVLRMDPGITLFEAVNGSDAVDIASRERPQVEVPAPRPRWFLICSCGWGRECSSAWAPRR
jgi:CheY-like chemotaxis protein